MSNKNHPPYPESLEPPQFASVSEVSDVANASLAATIATEPARLQGSLARLIEDGANPVGVMSRLATRSRPATGLQSIVRPAKPPIEVLAIDDDRGDAALLRRGLEQIPNFAIHFTHASSGAAGQAALLKRRFDLVFLDYRLGNESGLDAVMNIRAAGFVGPLIVVTGQGDEYTVADLMRAGADDYVCKVDVGPALLGRAIHNARNQQVRREVERRNKNLLGELQAAKQTLEVKNKRLTELYNTAHQFVDNVSHEFRTPLTVIKEFSSILRDGLAGPVNGEQSEYLDIVLNRCEDLNTMVDDMLDISKLEAGLHGMSRRTCAFADIVEIVKSTLERRALISKVKLEIQLDELLPQIYCDPDKIARVIINLTINALKFSRENGRVAIRAVQPPGESFVRVSVSDDGPGIAAEHLEAIFERFKQLECNVRSSTKGFGLGLSIAKELVHRNFGSISVVSIPDNGSTFSFTIPIAVPGHVLSLYLNQKPDAAISLVAATTPDTTDNQSLDDLNNFLQHQLRCEDLLFRCGDNHWLIVAAAGLADLDPMRRRLTDARREINQNRTARQLPSLTLDARGSWYGQEQFSELTHCFEEELQSGPQQRSAHRQSGG